MRRVLHPGYYFCGYGRFCLPEGGAKLSQAYAEATTAKITVLVGKAYGPAYIAVAGKAAGADAVLAWPTAAILPLAPETAIHIFWKGRSRQDDQSTEDRKALAAEYAETEGSVFAAAAAGEVTDVVAPADTKAKLMAMLDMLSSKRVTRLPKKHSISSCKSLPLLREAIAVTGSNRQ